MKRRLVLAALLLLVAIAAFWLASKDEVVSSPGNADVAIAARPMTSDQPLARTEPATVPSAETAPQGEPAGACSLSGVVTLDGKPHPSVAVTLFREEDFTTVDRYDATSDADGRYSFGGLPLGFFRVSAWQQGFVPAGARMFQCHQDEAGDVELALRIGNATIRGTVQDTTGRPVRDAHVGVFQDRRGTVLAGPAFVPLDERGGFEVKVVSGEPYRVDGTAPGYKFAGTTANPGIDETAEITLVLKEEAFVHGRVLAASAPVAWATVTAFGFGVAPSTPASTTADGRFSLPAPIGKRFAISARSGTRFGSARVAPIAEGTSAGEVVVVLAEGRTLRGIVRLGDGTPQPLAEVFFRNRQLGFAARAQCGLDGRFTMDGLPASANVEVWAGGSYFPRIVEAAEEEIELELLPGQHVLGRAREKR